MNRVAQVLVGPFEEYLLRLRTNHQPQSSLKLLSNDQKTLNPGARRAPTGLAVMMHDRMIKSAKELKSCPRQTGNPRGRRTPPPSNPSLLPSMLAQMGWNLPSDWSWRLRPARTNMDRPGQKVFAL